VTSSISVRFPVKAEAPNEKALLPTIAQLAVSIQQNLSLSSDVLQELRIQIVSAIFQFLAGPAEATTKGCN